MLAVDIPVRDGLEGFMLKDALLSIFQPYVEVVHSSQHQEVLTNHCLILTNLHVVVDRMKRRKDNQTLPALQIQLIIQIHRSTMDTRTALGLLRPSDSFVTLPHFYALTS